MSTVVIRLIESLNKEHDLRAGLGPATRDAAGGQSFTVDVGALKQLPGMPFAYWASKSALRVFWIESNGKWEKRTPPLTQPQQVIDARSSAAVKAALEDFAQAPAPVAGRRGRL